MSKLTFDISVSLDGFVAGPSATLEDPARRGRRTAARLGARTGHVAGAARARGRRGEPRRRGRRRRLASTGAVIMGRRMFSGGEGPWADDSNADGWWGDEPPFRGPVFILTHHEREPVQKRAGRLHVRDGRDRFGARPGARGRGRQHVLVSGGASSCSSTCAPVSSTSSSSTSCRCSSAAACACSTTSATTHRRWSSRASWTRRRSRTFVTASQVSSGASASAIALRYSMPS